MKEFRLLNAANAEGYESWLRTWSEWPFREVFAHPEYVKLFARKCDHAICAVQENADGLILLPLILRPLSAEGWTGEDDKHFDVVAPYGFGGPYVLGRYDMEKFWRQLQNWAVETGVISAFFRFSPYAADISEFIDTVEICGGNVIRSLTEGRDEIWKDYKHAVRTCVRSAERSGVTVQFDEIGASFPDFIRLYYQTMQRCNAASQYYFPDEFFHKITTRLPGQFFLAHAMYQGEVIASKMVLSSHDHIYPFLGGVDDAFLKLNPNELLDTQIFNWGIEQEKKSSVLGGGHEGYDGVFQYKKKFAPSGVVPYRIGKHIFDPVVYQALCAKRKNYESEQEQLSTDNGTFFPAYRAGHDITWDAIVCVKGAIA